MKNAMIYERKNIFYIRASSQTTTGVWIDDGDCYAISTDSDLNEIGKYVRIALNNSKSDVPHPTKWKDINDALLSTAKVKSWSSFGKIAKCVTITIEKDIKIFSTVNKSNCNQGFVVDESTIILSQMDIGDMELGENIKKAWLSCV